MENLEQAKKAYTKAVMDLLENHETYYYGHFVLKMYTRFTEEVPTAGVSVTNKINLVINPDFFLGLTAKQRAEVLIHEAEHVIRLDVCRTQPYTEQQELFNIVQDCHINEKLPALKSMEGLATFERLNKELKEKGADVFTGPEHLTESNIDIVKHYIKQSQYKTVDDHSGFGKEGMDKETAKAIVQKAANSTAKMVGAGNLPGHIQQMLDMLNKSVVNWKKELRQFVVKSQQHSYEKTKNRSNRRYGLLQPGRRKKNNVHLAMCIDSSGSVSDDAFTQVFAEMAEIHKQGVKITVLDADCEVAAVYEFDPKLHKQPVRHGNGGTYYGAAIKKSVELGVDGIIYAGDFDCSDTPENPKLPFLWLGINTQQKAPADFGKVIYAEIKKA